MMLSLNNSRFGDRLHAICPSDTQKSTTYIDLHIEMELNCMQ